MKNEVDGTMIWERGNGRLMSSDNLDVIRKVSADFIDSPISLKVQENIIFQKNRFES